MELFKGRERAIVSQTNIGTVSKDEKEPSSVRLTLELFQRQRWQNFWETGWRVKADFSERVYTQSWTEWSWRRSLCVCWKITGERLREWVELAMKCWCVCRNRKGKQLRSRRRQWWRLIKSPVKTSQNSFLLFHIKQRLKEPLLFLWLFSLQIRTKA